MGWVIYHLIRKLWNRPKCPTITVHTHYDTWHEDPETNELSGWGWCATRGGGHWCSKREYCRHPEDTKREQSDTRKIDCPTCKDSAPYLEDSNGEVLECPTCKGSGHVKEVCPRCSRLRLCSNCLMSTDKKITCTYNLDGERFTSEFPVK